MPTSNRWLRRANLRVGVSVTPLAILVLLVAQAPWALAAVGQAPDIDTRGLPVLAEPWSEENPYRGNALAADIGRRVFNHRCASCHGADADGSRAPAPDLRRLGRSCKRVKDPQLQRRCRQDVDVYFSDSVRRGKVKVGVRHMPAWDGILKPELVWSIRTFLESTLAASTPLAAHPSPESPGH